MLKTGRSFLLKIVGSVNQNPFPLVEIQSLPVPLIHMTTVSRHIWASLGVISLFLITIPRDLDDLIKWLNRECKTKCR